MLSKTTSITGPTPPARLRRWARVGLLALPCLLVAAAALRTTGERAGMLWFGAAFELAVGALALGYGPGWQGPVDLAVMILYVTGICWLIGAAQGIEDWYIHVAQAVLLVVPLACYAAKFLRESGAPALRQARILADRLARRRDWPAELSDCRLLPEVAALRAALQLDASPALRLMLIPRPQVQVVALAALEGRGAWRRGQVEPLLQMARQAAEPEIRVGVVRALANVNERELVEELSEFLCDSSRRVRQAAVDALLRDTDRHWTWIRPAVRRALAEATLHNDGPLRPAGGELGPEATIDLTAWTSEKGLLGLRAALTLGAHYARQLSAEADSGLLAKMRRKVEDVHAPPMLRLELARLLHQYKALDEPLLRHLVSPSTPAPLRLLAVEGLLAAGETGQAVAALHDLGRLPNREIALAVAEVAQRRLGITLGLPIDQPTPAVHSRLAAEVAHRVLAWATQQDCEVESSPEVGSMEDNA
jgi:HEAT repeat protein